MKHPVDDHRVIENFEINTAVIGAESVEGFSLPSDLAKAIAVEMGQIGLGHFKGIEEFELIEGIHPGDVSRANFIKDNL